MADERRIVIELKNVDGGTDAVDESSKTADKNSEFQKTLRTLLHPIKTAEQNAVGRNIIVVQAYQQAKQIVKEVGQYHIYKYFTLKENYLAETDYNNMLTGVSKVAGFGGSVAAGAILGAKLGPRGAIAGAVISGGSWIFSAVLENKEKTLQQRISLNTYNYQSQFQQTRLGLIDGRGVTNQ